MGTTGRDELTIGRLRQELQPYVARPLWSAIRTVVFDYSVYVLALWWALASGTAVGQLTGGIGMGLIVTNLFMVGHDANHGSFTSHPRLNHHLSWLVLLPGYHPSSCWTYSHNHIHHGYTNLKGKDFVWLPLTKAEYDSRSRLSRLRIRASRHTAGFGLGYATEVWWRHLMCPPRGHATWKNPYIRDRLLVVGAIAALTAAALRTGGGAWAVFCIVVVPFLIVSWAIGFVVYFNHTHPDVPWFAERDEWNHVSGQVDGTVDLRFPGIGGSLLGNIMKHAAHHVHPGVPLTNLDRAQDHLDEFLGDRAVIEMWSARRHAEIVRTCKLYDYDAKQWLDYDGRPTSAPARSIRSELEQPLLQPT